MRRVCVLFLSGLGRFCGFRRPVVFFAGKALNEARNLVDGARDPLDQTVYRVGRLRVDAENGRAAVLCDNEEAPRGHGNARAAAAAEREGRTRQCELACEVGAARTEAERYLGYRNDRRAVRRREGVADDGVDVHHFLDLCHGLGHQVADGMLIHFLSPFF